MIRRNEIAFEDGVEDRGFSKAKGLSVECICTGLLRFRDFITFVIVMDLFFKKISVKIVVICLKSD